MLNNTGWAIVFDFSFEFVLIKLRLTRLGFACSIILKNPRKRRVSATFNILIFLSPPRDVDVMLFVDLLNGFESKKNQNKIYLF